LRALLFALLIPLLQTPPGDAAPQRDRATPAGNAAVSGRVYSAATGAPLRGALVVLAPLSTVFDGTSMRMRGEPSSSSASTDAAGGFRITSVVPGVYYLVAWPSSYSGRNLAAGHGTVRGNDPGKPITVGSGADLRGLDIALPLSLAIEGRVLDDAGEPVSRMAVFAARFMPGSDSVERVLVPPSVTDDLGRFRIFGLEAGTYVIGTDGRGGVMFVQPVEGGGRVTSMTVQREAEPFITTFHPSTLTESESQRIRLSSQDVTGVDIMLRRARRLQLSGVLIDSQGAPASTNGLLVRKQVLNMVDNRQFHANEQGRFVVTGIDPGEYRLLVGPGLASGLAYVNGRAEFAEVPLTITADMPDLVVVTQPGIGMAGQVVFTEGAASLPKMRIAFRRPETLPPSSREIVAKMDDEFRFYGSEFFGPQLVRVTELPAGWVLKAVTLAGTDITDVPTVFRQEDHGQLQIVLSSKASALEGTVRGEGSSPPGDATVYVFSHDRSGWRMSSPRTHKGDAGANGKFTVGGLAAGRYYAIAVAREGFRPPANPGESFFDLLSRNATPFVIGDDERRTLELPLWRWPE
jgi:hypothetical protein